MSDQVLYNNPSDQPTQNGKNNSLMWVVLAGFVVVLIFLYMIFSGGEQTANTTVPSPQETQVPQNPQNTQIPQIPQIPQETQVPQNPQNTQVPQNPQNTQVPQPTAIPMPTE